MQGEEYKLKLQLFKHSKLQQEVHDFESEQRCMYIIQKKKIKENAVVYPNRKQRSTRLFFKKRRLMQNSDSLQYC